MEPPSGPNQLSNVGFSAIPEDLKESLAKIAKLFDTASSQQGLADSEEPSFEALLVKMTTDANLGSLGAVCPIFLPFFAISGSRLRVRTLTIDGAETLNVAFLMSYRALSNPYVLLGGLMQWSVPALSFASPTSGLTLK